MSHRKRKHRQQSDTYSSQYDRPASPSPTRPDSSLFIVAHEADIIRGPQAARSADSLEVAPNVDGREGSRIGDGLIKWENGTGADAEGPGMWVDRCVTSFSRHRGMKCAVLRGGLPGSNFELWVLVCHSIYVFFDGTYRGANSAPCVLCARSSIGIFRYFSFSLFHPHCPRERMGGWGE
jgi:hypothetical protein